MPVRGVTFDFWNTLIGEYDGARAHRVAALREVLAAEGVERSVDEVDESIGALRVWFDDEWVANRVVNPEVGAARVADALGLDPEPQLLSAVAGVFHAGGDPDRLTVAPGIAETLAELRAAEVRVGIICDTGFAPGATLRRYLDHHDLLRYFDHWSFSDEVGVFKPDAAIFSHAAAGLGLSDPSTIAHVGDLRRTDVGGARRAGWTAVRYRGLHDDVDESSPDAEHVIDRHDQLVAVLGLR